MTTTPTEADPAGGPSSPRTGSDGTSRPHARTRTRTPRRHTHSAGDRDVAEAHLRLQAQLYRLRQSLDEDLEAATNALADDAAAALHRLSEDALRLRPRRSGQPLAPACTPALAREDGGTT